MGAEIVVNGRFLSRRVTGVERCAAEILACLGERVRVIRPGSGTLSTAQGMAGHAWEQLSLPGQIPAGTVLWSPANTGPLAAANQVLSLYDLSPLEHPEWFKPAFAAWYRLFLPPLVRRVKSIITLSEHVRQKILARFHLPAGRVAVIPPGVDVARFHPQVFTGSQGDILADRPYASLGGSRDRYILFVGSLEPRKNLPALLAAWQQIERQHPDVSLVLAGSPGTVFRPARLAADVERVCLAGFVPEAALPALYAGAEVFVLPSLDEGFGLPVLEAMACGTPVIASTGGALPEAVGNAGLLFDPHDPSALAQALQRCLSQPELRRSLRERGLDRARQFSWASAAEKTWQILREAQAGEQGGEHAA